MTIASTTDLIYRLRADGSQVGKELKKTQAGFQSFAAGARKSVNAAGKAVAGLAVGLGALVVSSNNAVDELTKLADSSGIAVENMGALELAADLGGTSIESVAKAFQRTSRGMKDDAKVFEELGISVRDNVTGELRDSFDVVSDFADIVQEMGPGAETTALAMELMGKSGAELIPVLKGGSEGLAAMRQEADELGLTFDEKAGRSAERFNDSLSRLQKVQKGIFRQLALEVIPIFTNYSEALVQTSRSSDAVGESSSKLAKTVRGLLTVFEGARSGITIIGKVIAVPFAVLGTVLGSIIERVGIFGDEISRVFTAVVERDFASLSQAPERVVRRLEDNTERGGIAIRKIFKQTFSEIESEAIDFESRMDAIWDESAPSDEAVDKVKSFTPPDDVVPLASNAKKEVDLLGEATRSVADAWAAARAEHERFRSELEAEGARVFAATRTETEKMQAEVDRLNELWREGVISTDTLARGVRGATESLREQGAATKEVADGVEEVAEKTGQAQEQFSELGQGAANQLFSTFENALFRPFDASLSDMVAGFIEAVGRMAFRAAAANLVGSLFGGAAGGVGGFASGGLVTGPGTSTSDSIPARLSDGEFVVRQQAVQHYGSGFFERLNRLSEPSRFAEGGQASGSGDMAVTVVNVTDEKEVERFLASKRGERVILNTLRRTGNG